MSFYFSKAVIFALFLLISTRIKVSSLGSMSSIAVSYGENGPAVCALSSDGSHLVTCLGADRSIVYGAPSRLPLIGITAGDSFVCGLLMDSKQPYCWGSNFYVKMGVPQPMQEAAAYSSISAGDNHLCGLRVPTKEETSLIDCWGYNMTSSHEFSGRVSSITAGSVFNCGLFERNLAPFCFGDETGSNVISLVPRGLKFQYVSAGGFHVCGILENFQVFCWGENTGTSSRDNVELVPMDPMVTVVGGRFHSCGIKKANRGVICWGLRLPNGVPPPKGARVYALAAGDYFTCGVVADKSLTPLCWGTGGPWSLPVAVSPGVCTPNECSSGFFEYSHETLGDKFCEPEGSRVCLPCSNACTEGTYQLTACNATSDRTCQFNCSSCASAECSSFCHTENKAKGRTVFSLQLPVFIAGLLFAFVLVASVALASCFYVRYKLRKCRCSGRQARIGKSRVPSFNKESVKVRPEMDDLKLHRARMFTYEELEKATGGFKEESQVGKGSFSCVFKGVLKDGTEVAVKRALVVSSDMKKNSKEFRTELDLLSRLNHAHLLNLLGYCEEGGERLLVYEFMAHGSLYQHLHGKDPSLKEQLDWVRRVTIAVQAARGIEYLHGYACPPVIHRDIKSSNILIDEENNARVADFGLSLLGPADSSSPLSELPAGTLGYLDPEYYRLHYLTTKSDVYSFGVLLLEILSGRKAIDMRFDEGNIVEWAVPLIKADEISAILDPALQPPPDLEAVKKIAATACKCVRMKGKDRPSMDRVTTSLERALALLMGTPCNEQPILPTEVVLGSSRLHKNAPPSQRSSNQSVVSENETGELEDQRLGCRAPSWITFPSLTSSSRRGASEADAADGKLSEGRNMGNASSTVGDSLRCLEEEIGPASPQEELYLQHNF